MWSTYVLAEPGLLDTIANCEGIPEAKRSGYARLAVMLMDEYAKPLVIPAKATLCSLPAGFPFPVPACPSNKKIRCEICSAKMTLASLCIFWIRYGWDLQPRPSGTAL
ncbi:hypothetical protein GPECTOR_211g423 [Gonium pectorale]|uniref:Uncharacterized protein n=1 Tax=Gonium pectorale TaxID=33097 RepID=A0A150FWT4_GONPE|nr:hypothetical protein GPECTOR_211g423 [Gonium pectorale]|eukprot:KXZ42071.1 hypothetical protein GPECTOR_211g423 [Gonium pectorale]